MKNLKNKIAVVTGASQGIGRAISIRLAKEGCTLALIARGKEGLEKVAQEIRSKGGKMVPYTAARYAMVGFSRSLHEELKQSGIGVSLLCPGHVNTGYFEKNDANMDWYPKISKMFPTIEPDLVGEKAIYAIINSNKREVIFPFILWFFVRFNQTFPSFTLAFLNLFGLFKPTIKR